MNHAAFDNSPPPPPSPPNTAPAFLVPTIRESLQAKLERLLARPLVAQIAGATATMTPSADHDPFFSQIMRAVTDVARTNPWQEDPETGACTVRIAIDYLDRFRGREKEILDSVKGTIESSIVFLTEAQRVLLERTPREFLALDPSPETAELVAFEQESVGGSPQVVALTVAKAPESTKHLRHVAIVPNLFQLERQLDALQQVEAASNDGPLAPLRALVGLCNLKAMPVIPCGETIKPSADERLDEFQAGCIQRALCTPHFALIHGPPGSGKTTVISGIIRRALARGERVIVVSPTHVAVDNVVEKVVPREDAPGADTLEVHTLPVRYAARTGKLSKRALTYWVGAKKELRAATLSRRVAQRLIAHVPFAAALYAMEDTDALGHAPLSAAVAGTQSLICGTPIGILSYEAVKQSPAGAFDLLIVDEVSKMTLPEFLAIAIKARRWVLVGDPEQLPPFNSCEENATALDALIDPALEVVCSVSARVEALRPFERQHMRVVVVSATPARVVEATRAQLSSVFPDPVPTVSGLDEAMVSNIIVCAPQELDDARARLWADTARDCTHNPQQRGSVDELVERGVRVARPVFASGARLVDEKYRAQAIIFAKSFDVYHTMPWSRRSGHALSPVASRRGLDKCLPSTAALQALAKDPTDEVAAAAARRALLSGIAERFAVNAVSVFDWLTGIAAADFDVSPLRELGGLSPVALCEAVKPFVGRLKKQYRMHPSLSRVPRTWFYFGEALHDGKPSDQPPPNRVSLQQVDPPTTVTDNGESNQAEADALCAILQQLRTPEREGSPRPSIMVITPYRRQEALLERTLAALRSTGGLDDLEVDLCTLDRCQGREADYVFISLVRSRATPFMDMPKRWNVALTRAMKGLFILGDLRAYREEARTTRRDPHRVTPPTSLIARLLEAYAHQAAEPRG